MLKRKIVLGISAILVIALSIFISFIRQQYVAPIAMYHSINPVSTQIMRALIVSPESFERQARFLKAWNYNVISLEALADLIKNGKNIPSRTLTITFDDGYKDNYNYAYPILKKHGLPATMFIIVDEVGRPDRLSWSEIKEMQDSGLVTFGSHCMGPEPLINIESEEELKRQIFESRRILGEELGREVNTFSYPEGRFNPRIRQLVIEAGYQVAVATSPGKKFASNDIFALKRLRISPTSDSLFVFWAETSGFYTFIKEHRDDD